METKKQFRYFTIFNHQKEEEYLKKMHSQGWKFIKVSGFGVYHFEKCEAENVVYQLDYNPKIKENRDEYLQMFSDCGWEYIQEYAGYTYFRKKASDMNENETIFNDDDSLKSMIGRVCKDRMMPLVFIVLVSVIPQFVMNLINRDYYDAIFYGVILGIYVSFFTYVFIRYIRMKRK